MIRTVAPYLMAVSAMLFAALSALTLIYTVKHLDPPASAPDASPAVKEVPEAVVA